ncbi:Predicted dehydrogenase [Arthrobacter alpinus]|uniref:Predicted dehydrogenase n=1 Tax=Arthrobacter alpinus TaxID=656366 RepID=A0A1H5MS42_9MICC|nr:Gfo/Idh/MocA family oxidoreductase [Arthrobacter alpinus]SEE92195.1 Predicted dehydrogenase [Arthrobacter alpinus]
MTQKIRTALLGYGLAGSVFHGPSLDLLDQYSLDVIVASDPGRQAEARAAHPKAQVISRDEWAGSRSDIDLVVVATPPASHGQLAAAAIRGGCAVVVDKPFALTSAEGEALLALAKEHGQILSTYQNRRWDGEYLTLTKLLAQGALGDVRRFESRLERWQPEITKEWKIQATVATGGGLLFDLGTHLIDQALQLFGPVENVYGELEARRPMEQAEDDVFIALKHVSGVTSHLWLNACAAHNGPRFRVLGSEAAYVKYGADVQESQIRQGILPNSAGYGIEPEDNWGLLGRGNDTVAVPTEPGNFSRFYELLAAAILDGAPVPVDPADAIAGLRIIERIRSAR